MMRKTLVVLALLAAGVAQAGAPLSQQDPGTYAWTSRIDPTATTFNGSHPAVACASGCSVALVNQNTDALQAAIALSAANGGEPIGGPCGVYPILRGGVAHTARYGLLVSALANVTLDWPCATIMASGNLTGGDYYMVQVSDGSSHADFLPGVVWSMRDVTNSSEHSHVIEIGFGTPVDDVLITGETFTEMAALDGSKVGDCINLTGGVDAQHLVTRVAILGNLLQCARSGVGYQHGTYGVNVVGNWFGPTITDQAIDHEPTSPGGNFNENNIANVIARGTVVGISYSTSGADTTTAGQNVSAYNNVTGTINGGDMQRNWFIGNVLTAEEDPNADANAEFFRDIEDLWFVDNKVYRGPYSLAGTLTVVQNSSTAPQNVWVCGDRFRQYGGTGAQLTAVATASLVDSDWFNVTDGVLSKDYEFDVASNGCTGGRVCISLVGVTTAVQVATAMGAAIAANQPAIHVRDQVGVETLTVGQSTIGATEHVANGGFLSVGYGVGPGVQLDGVSNFWVTDDQITYHGVTPDSGGGSGFVGVLARSQVQAASGWVSECRVRRDLQADGVTQAGRPLVGYDVSTDTFTHVGHVFVLDSLTDNARDQFIMTQATLDEGPPVLSGNVGLATQNENAPTLWTTSTTVPETVASGALQPANPTSYLTVAGAGTTHSLAACSRAGDTKLVKWTTVAGGGGDTLTIAGFGDGSSLSTATANAFAELACDGTTWWLGNSANVTVSP